MAIGRRGVLLGGAGLLGLAWLRPGNQGGPYDPYFAKLNLELQEQGISRPRLLLDLDRVDANIDEVMRHMNGDKQWRIVVKSLPSIDLLRYAMARSGSKALMAFHQPFINIIAREFPDADVLLGKPLPVAALASFYRELPAGGFDPQRQLQWLVDSDQRLADYQQLAQAVGTRLRISLELDVGLHRGGFADADSLRVALARIAADPEHLQLGGFMGYEAFIAKLPGKEARLRATIDTYKQLVAAGQADYPQLFAAGLTLNTAGSQTYQMYQGETFFNDISAGSGVVMPTDFDMPTLASHQSACFITTPILKHYEGVKISGIEPASALFSLWNPNRQQSFYIYGGNWQAEYVNPPGLLRNPVWGHSSNQEMVNASLKAPLQVGDFVFLRPRQSEAVFLQFGDILGFRGGRLTQQWPVFTG